MTQSDLYDVIVIGAGAAGLLAADHCARLGRRTLLLEKNSKPGVKILISGGTRCNLTQATDAQGILAAFPVKQARFLRTAVYAFDPDQVISYFNDAGVATKREATGKIFPTSDRALDVQRALWSRVTEAGVESLLKTTVVGIKQNSEQAFEVSTDQTDFTSRRVIVTVGGASYSGCGTCGDGYAWMTELGHTVVTPRPALVPLVASAAWISELSGLTMDDVQLSVVRHDTLVDANDARQRLAVGRKKAIARRRGSLLLTHFGLSGPAAMDVSRAFTDQVDMRELVLLCDFLPAVKVDSLEQAWSSEVASNGSRRLLRFLSTLLPQRLVERITEEVGVSVEQRMAEVNKLSKSKLFTAIKSMPITINSSRGFAKAEVTAGGVHLRDVNAKTMESKIVSGLYVAGELLDVDGPIGGYNFQAAFSTGRLAAESVDADLRAAAEVLRS